MKARNEHAVACPSNLLDPRLALSERSEDMAWVSQTHRIVATRTTIVAILRGGIDECIGRYCGVESASPVPGTMFVRPYSVGGASTWSIIGLGKSERRPITI
jgi:hypothetical protein